LRHLPHMIMAFCLGCMLTVLIAILPGRDIPVENSKETEKVLRRELRMCQYQRDMILIAAMRIVNATDEAKEELQRRRSPRRYE